MCNINTGLSLKLFSFGRHRSAVYFHFHSPHSLVIGASGAPYLSRLTPHLPPSPTLSQASPGPLSLSLSLLALSAAAAAAAAVLGSLCLLHIILLKIKVILLSSIFLSL